MALFPVARGETAPCQGQKPTPPEEGTRPPRQTGIPLFMVAALLMRACIGIARIRWFGEKGMKNTKNMRDPPSSPLSPCNTLKSLV
ncbi:hypothetical protein Taro_024531 [Colocasia esculenta]|uniref:Uncharacterized protein n=1 Tax=Colocasia esculenta TaxID=4460 RepID=A0A843V9M8_COLES|nr:hypothetical protein [Colocasia esculenta]